MRAIVQRVIWAEVSVGGEVIGRIDHGLLVYVGVAGDDTPRQVQWLAAKVATLRIFEDSQDKMNRSVQDIAGSVLVVTNFTLLADAQKGRRPSFIAAARPEVAKPISDSFVEALRDQGVRVATGEFGAMMTIRSEADGPVNLVIDTPTTT
jgi:D-tyrosyl-tRNA(Tyr) deacylase